MNECGEILNCADIKITIFSYHAHYCAH